MLAELERRIKRIEDELGITDLDGRKKLIKDVTMLCIQYGFKNHDAKPFAWKMVNDGYTYQQLEELLIARGAVKRSNNKEK